MNQYGISRTSGHMSEDSECPFSELIYQVRTLRSLVGISGVKFRCLPSGGQPPQFKEAPGTDMQYGVQTFT